MENGSLSVNVKWKTIWRRNYSIVSQGTVCHIYKKMGQSCDDITSQACWHTENFTFNPILSSIKTNRVAFFHLQYSISLIKF